jgi:oligoribonuclease
MSTKAQPPSNPAPDPGQKANEPAPAPARPRNDLLVWMDLEMTGLDPERERILELSVVLTDNDLEILALGPELVIHQGEAQLAGMDEWNTRQHRLSGLTERARQSSITEADAEKLVLDFLRPWIVPRSAPLCGNSIWQDRRFICRYLPALDQFLHYRLIDVSTLKELCGRWRRDVHGSAPAKREGHRAQSDVLESIAELRHYRQRLFTPPATGSNGS